MALIRAFREADASSVVAVVRRVFDEYGFAWVEDGYCVDLYDVPGHYDAFWVAELQGRVVGGVGLKLHDTLPGQVGEVWSQDGVPRAAGSDCELCRLYVVPEGRGHRLGLLLTETVRAEAQSRGRLAIELWSDFKLTHAHALYERLGAVRIGQRVCPGDPDESPEWGFVLRTP
ncbi:MAG: GNAT family N-acetyltransferase [Fimbriimonadaceae bacterium]|nr:GNAT family N-acetyltransferase [Fimbriimonadaceae bacterium]QYK59114.1 MAG: GNAT family N-acetyltransferase [Fimbriimonadaceae bacterium]